MDSQNKMATQPIWKLIVSMSLPPLFSMFLQYSYNFVDSAFVAQIGENALTAVSLSFPITTLMNATSIWIGVGANVLLARYLGKGQQKEADKVAALSILMAVICGIILNVIVLLLIKPYFSAFAKEDELFNLCKEYMTICAFMQIPNMVHIVIQKIIQATGNMLTPMWFQISGVVFNFIFDPILIFGIGIFPEMGIRGAAISTVMGYTLSMILAIIMLFCKKQKVQASFHGEHISWNTIKEIFSLGLPSFIMNALASFMVTFANIFLVVYSTTAVAFFGAYFRVQQLVVMTVNGLIQGCLPIMSFNYGAGNMARLKKTFFNGTWVAACMMGTGAIILIVFPVPILQLFNASNEMISFGVVAMRIMAWGYVFNGISTMIATYAQSIGFVGKSIFINLLRQLVMLIPGMWIFSKLLGITGIWIAFPITEIITFLVAYFIWKNMNRL